MAPCAGVLRSFLTPQPASPGLAPLASSHRATPPAFASAPRPGLRRRVALVPRCTPRLRPPFAAERRERASGTSFVSAERVGSRCRLRSRRLKRNLFDVRPLFRLTRRLLRRLGPLSVLRSQNPLGNGLAKQGQADGATLFAGGVGVGRSRLGQASLGRRPSARGGAGRSKPRPPRQAPAIPRPGRCGPVVAGAPPPRTAPPTVQRRWRGA